MARLSKHYKRQRLQMILITALAIILLVVIFGWHWVLVLRKAHSSFEDYYSYRGCKQLMVKTFGYGICKIDSGQEIKIVEYKGKWYLDGDLPS